MQAHIHSEPGTGDWSRFSTGYGPGATFRGQKLGDSEYVLEHLSGVAFSGTRDELTTLMNDGLHHLEILSGPADHSQTFAPARELPPIAGVDVVKAALAVKPVDPKDCPHTAASMVYGHYRYCAQCGVRTGATQ